MYAHSEAYYIQFYTFPLPKLQRDCDVWQMWKWNLYPLQKSLYSIIVSLLTAILKGKDKLNRNIYECKGADQTTLSSNKRTCLVNKAKSNQRTLIPALFSTHALQHGPTYPHARAHTHTPCTPYAYTLAMKKEKENRFVFSMECTNKINYHSSYALSSQILTVLSNI